MTEQSVDQQTATVRILRLPVALYAQTRERHEGLLRELALLGIQEDADVAPSRLVAFGERLRARYGSLSGSAQPRLDEAVARGEEHIDLTYELPDGLADVADEYLELLEAVDDYCRHGDLLTLAAPPEIVAFRRWFLSEFATQLRGGEPTPWGGGA